MTANAINNLDANLAEKDNLMPVLFIGHGSPMNAIEQNEFTQGWKEITKTIPKPAAILFISAHWLTHGTSVTAELNPKTIHDFFGFPSELFAVQYPAPGDPELANEITRSVKNPVINLDHDWGLDHGSWSVAKNIYPLADMPMIQLSIDYYKPAQYHYDLAKELSYLRSKGVLIIGSGNMVHNLRQVDFNLSQGGYDWAVEMNENFKQKILDNDHQALISYESFGRSAKLAVPTPDHYYPLIYTLGLQRKNEPVFIFNDKAVFGSLTMTSVKFG